MPFAAGGDPDLSGRNLALQARKYLNNRPIIVADRVGASGSIGSAYVRNASRDGYTPEEAKKNGWDALTSWLAVAEEFGVDAPKPFFAVSGRFVQRGPRSLRSQLIARRNRRASL